MAEKDDPQNLFRRLTRLFKSGPVVRRKVRGFDTSIAVADKTKSSGVLLFQKSMAPSFSTITSNAYNLSERLMRYNDYNEMLMTPEIATALDIYCLAPDTVIPLLNGTKLTVKDLYDKACKNFGVYSFDTKNNKFVPGNCLSVRKTGTNQPLYRLTFDDGTWVKLTENHLVLLSDGTYKRVKELVVADSVRSLYTKISSFSCGDYIEGYEQFLGADGHWIYTHRMVAEHTQPNKKGVVHHVDFNKRNNENLNLAFMSRKEHQKLHYLKNSERWKLDEKYAKKMSRLFSEHAKKLHAIPGWTKQFIERRNEVFASYDEETRCELFGRPGMQNGMYMQGDKILGQRNGRWDGRFARHLEKHELIDFISAGTSVAEVCKMVPIRYVDLQNSMRIAGIKKWAKMYLADPQHTLNDLKNWINKQPVGTNLKRSLYDACRFLNIERVTAYAALETFGYKNWGDFLSKTNHRIVSIEHAGFDDVYDLEVENWHNFAIAGSHDTTSFIMVHNSDETCAQDDHGRILHIYSDNEKVRETLEGLFYDTLNIEFNLRSWVRNLCQNGDVFVYNDVHPKYGVVSAFPIPVNEIEREENYDREDPFAVRFRWVTLGNRTLENWEVSHFRLLGQDTYLPYGCSLIEAARKVWRQLILLEDAMLVYRVVRAPERRVFYIDVGNTPPNDVDEYMEAQRRALRSSQVVDKTTGRVDLRYAPLCLSLGTTIRLQDNRTVTLKELIEERDTGKQDQWVYSVDLENKRLVPGKVSWAGITRKDAELVRVTLDDGSWRDTTPDHRYMLRDGTFCRADQLQPDQALMPLYTKLSSRDEGDYIHGYEKCYDPFTGEYEYTHRINAEFSTINTKEDARQKRVVHHVDFKKLNNSPDNLQWMNFYDHYDLHANDPEHHRLTSERNKRLGLAKHMQDVYNGTALHKEHNKIRSAAMSEVWNDPERRAETCANMRYRWDDTCQAMVIAHVKMLDKFEGLTTFIGRLKDDAEFVGYYTQLNSHLGRDAQKSFYKGLLGEFIKRDFPTWKDLWKTHNPVVLKSRNKKFKSHIEQTSEYKNHKVVSIEFLTAHEDTGCITVDTYHNFAAGSSKGCNDVNNDASSWIYLHNSIEEDYFLPIRGGDTGTKIDTLSGGQNAAAIEDVAYLQKKLIAGLKIPRAYLGYDDTLSSKASLAQLDIRFSRTINVIQKTIIAELNKLAIIHLYAHGFRDDDLMDFTLRMSNPSTVAQQQKLELWRSKFEIGGSLPEGMGSRRFVQREVWGLNDKEIEDINNERLDEAALDEAVAAGGEPGEETGGGGGEGEADLFGGGEETGGGAAEKPTGGKEETPPEENAGEEPEVEPEQELLTSVDDPEDDEDFAARVRELDTPGARVQPQLKRALYNKSRRRTHGASSTFMPDLNKMTLGAEVGDETDSEWRDGVVSNPLGEARITADIRSQLRRMECSKKFVDAADAEKNVTGTKVLAEGVDVQDEIDALDIDIDFLQEDAGVGLTATLDERLARESKLSRDDAEWDDE